MCKDDKGKYMISLKELFEHYQLEGLEKHQFKTEITHPFHRMRYIYLQQLIHKHAKGLVLDVGCAEGWFALWMPYHVEYVGIDISVPKIKRAIYEVKRKGKIAEFIVCSFDNLPFKEEVFNTIIWSEGPEHAINPERIFREFKKLLKDSGIIIISTMGLDPPSWYKFLRQMLRQWEKDRLEEIKWGHVSTFTKSSLQLLITKYFKLKEVVEIRPLFLIPIRKLQNLFEHLVLKLTGRYVGSAWPGFGCIFIVESKSGD